MGYKHRLVIIFSAVLLVYQTCLPLIARTRPIHSSDSIHPADLLSDDKNNSVPEQRAPVAGSVVENLTRQILRKELELARLNTVFRQQTTLTSPWRQRRLFAYGESSTCLTLTGLLLDLPVQYELANEKIKPRSKAKVHASPSQRNNLVAATRLALIGNSIGMGGDLFELGLNFIHYGSLRKNGFVPSMYRQRVHRLHAEIDNLIEQRRQTLTAVSDFSGEDKTVAEAEGKLLNDLRDLYLLEYMDYHAGCKKFWLVQNGAYLTDFAKNATGGAANILGLEAFHVHRPAMFGAGGLLTLISGTIVLIIPLVGRVTGNVSGLAARTIVSHEAAEIHTSTIETYSSDFRRLLAMDDGRSTSTYYATALRNRRSLYEDQEKIMLMRRQFLNKELKDAHNTLIENVVFGGVVGSTKMTYGILDMIAAWHYPQNTTNASKIYAAGTTTYTVGLGFAALETARLAAEFEWSNWKLRNSDLLPSNQFNRRLRMLDNMDSLLGHKSTIN